MSNSKQKYKHEDTGKVQEMTPAVAAMFPRFTPVRLETPSDTTPASVEAAPSESAEPKLLTEPAIVPTPDSTHTKAPQGASRARTKER